MVKHLGGQPSFAERLLIGRLAKIALRLEMFDEKLNSGQWTELDGKVSHALVNSFRLILRELGIKGSAKPNTPTLAEILTAHNNATRVPIEGAGIEAPVTPPTPPGPNVECPGPMPGGDRHLTLAELSDHGPG